MYLSTAVCDNGDIRLVGSAVPRQGRVEVCYNEAWGTVCDGLWSTNDANVACRQLGFSRFGVCVCVCMCVCVCVNLCLHGFYRQKMIVSYDQLSSILGHMCSLVHDIIYP